MASAPAARLRTRERVVGERLRRRASSLRLMGGVAELADVLLARLGDEILARLSRDDFAEVADFFVVGWWRGDFMDAEFSRDGT